MTRPTMSASINIQFKVFVKGDDGIWRVVSYHLDPREAEEVASLLMVRDGRIARVMM